MKIETDIAPRKDGTVRVTTPSGMIVFEPVNGALVADVRNDADLAFLLATGNFFPADEADHEQAQALIEEAAADAADQDGDDLPDDDGDENATPVEVPAEPKAKLRKK